MKRTSMILLAAGALTAVVTGTALAGGSHDATPTQSTSSIATATHTPAPTSDVTPGPTTSPSSSVSRERAGEIALAHVGGGKVIEVEPEVEHGRTVWSVKILKNGSRHKVYVDRSSGQIMRAEQVSASGDDKGGTTNTPTRTDDHGGDNHGHRSGTDDRPGTDDHGGHDDSRHSGTDDMGGDNHGRNRH
nr:PepSY domain-containing protein [Streptomyces sp. NBC_00830]